MKVDPTLSDPTCNGRRERKRQYSNNNSFSTDDIAHIFRSVVIAYSSEDMTTHSARQLDNFLGQDCF